MESVDSLLGGLVAVAGSEIVAAWAFDAADSQTLVGVVIGFHELHLVRFVAADWVASIRATGDKRHAHSTLDGKGSDERIQITILFKIDRLTLLIRVWRDLVGNPQIDQEISLDSSPTMTRIRIKLDFHIEFSLEAVGADEAEDLKSAVERRSRNIQLITSLNTDDNILVIADFHKSLRVTTGILFLTKNDFVCHLS